LKTIFRIEGMSCDHCVKHVKEALEEVEGVSSVVVSLEKNEAEVEHHLDSSQSDMVNAIEEVGYVVKQ
jgi:copper ion binding protein